MYLELETQRLTRLLVEHNPESYVETPSLNLLCAHTRAFDLTNFHHQAKMWLINCNTFKLEAITDPSQIHYAILSHTWEDEEVSFQEFQDLENAKRMKGFTKIAMACELAERQNLEYCWVDTCCIDKKSSAELTEAINSMFQWYKTAEICFAFLTDLPKFSELEQLRSCRWFTRGWTLQELIAPREMVFFDNTWQRRGSRRSLCRSLSSITGIDADVLSHKKAITEVCLAQRMSWAATRETTRVEDKAYCLLGLFDVYMPMLYGEGHHAFARLQEEIIKNSDDLSIFAWKASDESQKYRGIFAYSPDEYKHCQNVRWNRNLHRGHLTLTNRGVRFDHSCLEERLYWHDYGFALDCLNPFYSRDILSIRLAKTEGNTFVRVKPSMLIVTQSSYGSVTTQHQYKRILYNHGQNCYIPRYLTPAASTAIERQYVGAIVIHWGSSINGKHILSTNPSECWDPMNEVFINSKDTFAGFIRFSVRHHKSLQDQGTRQPTECILFCGVLPRTGLEAGSVRPIGNSVPWCCLWSNESARWNELLHLGNAYIVEESDIFLIIGGHRAKDYAECTCNKMRIRANMINSWIQGQEVFRVEISTELASVSQEQ